MNKHREGWLGGDYVRIYAAAERPRIAELYALSEFIPGYEPWGSWGQEALCLGRDGKLFVIPWIPLAEEFRKERYASMDAFGNDVLSLDEATPAYEHFGKEVHFIKPVVFGGNADDRVNVVMLDQPAHAEICQFWKRAYLRLRKVNT